MDKRKLVALAGLAIGLGTVSASVPALAGGYPNPDPGSSATVSLPPGSYVIDAGVVTGAATTQTLEQALKPYGLVYALVKEQIPVLWVINPTKVAVDQTLGNVGTDFVYDCDAGGAAYSTRNITTGAYIIEPEFVDQAKPIIDAFRALNGGFPAPGTISGVGQADGQILGYDPSPLAGQQQGCAQAVPTNVDVFHTITGWPRTVLDFDNGSIAVNFFDNAGIPQGPINDPANPPAYRFAAPSALTPCDDFYVMPHADPTYATHSNLRPFVEQGGSMWVGCHAVSVLENVRVNDSPTGALYLNFLTTDGLLDYSDHTDGSAPYNFFRMPLETKEYYAPTYGTYQLDGVGSGDPIAQFRGRTDAAHQNGSEQIFMPGYGTDPVTGQARTTWPANPADASHWREQTQIVLYDPTQANVYPQTTTSVPVDSLGPASPLVYGPAFGVPTNGYVLYEGGHDINRGTADDAAAQRAFFNLQLLNAVNRSPQVTVLQPAAGTTIAGGATIPVSASATGGSGVYTYAWSATCTDAGGAVVGSGTFADATAASTTFTAPVAAGQLDCNLAMTVIDTCGRFSFASRSVIVEANNPAISIAKSAAPNTVTASGDVVVYSFVVTNTGNLDLTSVGVTDPLPDLPAVSCPQDTLAASESMTCTASYTVTQADIDAGSIANTATATGTPPSGVPVTDDDSATVTATQSPSINVTKSALPATVSSAGEVVTYSFVVTNTGNATLTSVTVTDPLPDLSAVSCPQTTLAPGETTTCTATYTVSQADIDAGSIANTATVSGAPPSGPPVTDTGSTTVTATNGPSISVVKSAQPNTVTTVGEVITYSFAVTNTGNVTLTSVDVSDPLPDLSAISCPQTTLAPSVTMTCTATYTVTQNDLDAGSIANVATATGTPPSGPPVTDDGSATVAAPSGPAITIVKSTSEPPFNAVGQVLDFTLTATNIGNVTLTDVVITDAFAAIGTCSETTPATLAPGEALTCAATHTVTQADLDHGSFDNVAAVRGDTPQAATITDDSNVVTVPAVMAPAATISKSTSSSSFSFIGQQIPFTITVVNTGNVTLTKVVVTDPNATLGTCTPAMPATLAPGSTMTCSASHAVTQADMTALSFSNTAFLNADGGTTDISGSSNTVVVQGTPVTSIPETGNDTPTMLRAAFFALVAGVAVLIVSRRRGYYYLVLPPLESLRRPQ